MVPEMDNSDSPPETGEYAMKSYPLCPICDQPLMAINGVIIRTIPLDAVEVMGILRPALIHARCATRVLGTSAILRTLDNLSAKEMDIYSKVLRKVDFERNRLIADMRVSVTLEWLRILRDKGVKTEDPDDVSTEVETRGDSLPGGGLNVS